ncbi:delta(14)-sterol reductase [Galendromus occidentalis]|uniref:Delta(14)-sterol reductase n=1 Tax=Galendromus occidentalis TaxID=34638 RepID=A0AAJ7L455_9ACAR|nr:delta(14)-sterol reductase [Galendromus occidentalis]
MAKSQSPAKPRGRPKSKSEPKVEKERSKSRGRQKSRGRSPTPKAPKARKNSAKRSASRPRSRARSQSRKSEPKPRSRSSSRASQAAAKKAATPDKKVEVPSTRPRRTIAAREAAKGKTVVDGPADKRHEKKRLTVAELCKKAISGVKNFGYRRTLLAVFWLTVLPAYVVLLHLLCTRERCYPRWNIIVPSHLRTYFDPYFIGHGLASVALVAFFSAIPLGSVVNGFGYRRAIYKYRSNGLLTLILTFGAYFLATHFLSVPHAYVLQSSRFKSVCAMTLVSLVYATILYVKPFVIKDQHVNHGSLCCSPTSDNFVHDFVHGREVAPKIGQTYDLCLILLRTTNFLWAASIYSAVHISRNEGALNYNVLFVALVQAIYVLLGSYNEIHILKSAFINQGVGFLTTFICLVLTPICATLPLRYLLDVKPRPEYHVAVYVALSVAFLIGLFLIHHTNYIKYQNARSGGKKVLRTGAFAYVRHPNYLGELICAACWTLLCGPAVLPWAHFIYLVMLIGCRSRLLEKNTNYEYKQYADQVRSRIVPFVY